MDNDGFDHAPLCHIGSVFAGWLLVHVPKGFVLWLVAFRGDKTFFIAALLAMRHAQPSEILTGNLSNLATEQLKYLMNRA